MTSTLTLTLIQLGFLALLWIFVLVTVSVMRSDLFGVRVRRQPAPAAPKAAKQPKPPRQPKPPKPGKPGRGTPGNLVIIEGPRAGQVLPLSSGQMITIGRGPDNGLVLPDDYVSAKHARIYLRDGRWYVEDLGSTNGTQVGSNRITNPVPLNIGTHVRLGKSVVEVRK